MIKLVSITAGCLLVSLWFDPKKTEQGIVRGIKMFLRLLPVLLIMLALVSIALFLIPNETLIRYMGEGSGGKGWLIAALLGSVSLIPGMIAFPLCSVLVQNGVAYSTIAVFVTTLMMVGFITLPLESRFFGLKTSLVRNGLSLAGALLIGFLMSLIL